MQQGPVGSRHRFEGRPHESRFLHPPRLQVSKAATEDGGNPAYTLNSQTKSVLLRGTMFPPSTGGIGTRDGFQILAAQGVESAL